MELMPVIPVLGGIEFKQGGKKWDDTHLVSDKRN